MTSKDEMERQRFEKWFQVHWFVKVANMNMFERHRLRNIAWSAWQAALKSKQGEV
ncbi:hypothetical protein ACTUSR_08105 [Pantoea stewartii subsp. indologenes]|uniref:hypothetical protein n=1 Tax=Pantoea stewartii TaxID=66269 RepID=UPI003FA4955A